MIWNRLNFFQKHLKEMPRHSFLSVNIVVLNTPGFIFIVSILIRLIGFVIRALIHHLINILSVLVHIIHRWIESLFIQRKWRFFIRLQLFRILIGISSGIVASVSIYDLKYIKNCVAGIVAVRLILLLAKKRTMINVLGQIIGEFPIIVRNVKESSLDRR